MTAFELGYDAACRGNAITACPFHSQSGEAIAWRNGWREANRA